jgi:HEAT repeat protein
MHRLMTTTAVALGATLALAGCFLRPGSGGAPAAGTAVDDNVSKLLADAAAAQEQDDSAKLNVAITAIAAVGEPAIPRLSTALSDPDENVRMSAVQALARIKTPAVIDPLIGVLNDDSPQVRTEAVRALGERRAQRAVQSMLEHARNDDTESVRYDCLTSLGQIGDPAALPLLLDGTHDEDRYVRMWSMAALCDMHGAHAAELAPVLVRDPEVYVRRQVLISCAQALDTPRGRAALIDLALTDDVVTGSLARRNLATYREQGPEAEALTAQMREAGRAALKKSPQSLNAALLLGDLRDAAAVNGLIAALRNTNFLVRALAAHDLGEIGDRRAVPALIKALGDPQAQVASMAYGALRRFAQDGDPRAKAAAERAEKKTTTRR